MSDHNAKGKPKYESPVIVPLGEMARGAGAECAAGSNAVGNCRAGNSANPGYCQAGTIANPGYCTAGITASTACTDGTGATSACTAGSGIK
jgi:hypothetical protein